MELRHLRYFIAVAEEENVSRAALKLHVSQPALSRQIRDLENELGFQVLERTAKSVRLTEVGRFFLDEARAVVARTAEAVRKSQALAKGEQGEIHVGYAPSLTVEILPRTLRAFQTEFPKVRVRLHDLSTEEMLGCLSAGKLQVALLAQPSRAALRGLHFAALERYPICAVVALKHRFAKLRAVPLTEIVKEPFIGYSRADYPDYYTHLESVFASLKAKPRVVEEHDGGASLIAAVESGRGVAVAPSCLACTTGPRLKLIPLKPAVPPIVIGAAWKKDALIRPAENFIAAAQRITAGV